MKIEKIKKIAKELENDKKELVIILVNPQLGNNIGSVARVMANFSLFSLRIIKPRSGWLNSEAYSSAAGASAILDNAGIFNDFKSAVSDLDFLYATTARRRDIIKEVLSPRSATKEIRGEINLGKKIGILFGGEKSGLTNDQLAYADKIITAPVNPKFASLNLAQAVNIFSYEYYVTGNFESLGRVTQSDKGRTEGLSNDKTKKANKEEYIHFIEFVEGALIETGFFDIPEKQKLMLNNIRSMFQRQNLTQKDIKILFGIFKHILNS